MPQDSGTEWPLTAREHELDCVAAALERGGALLTGGPGAGKSRLLHAALERAERAGHAIAWLHGPLDTDLDRHFGEAAADGGGGSRLVLGADDVHLAAPGAAERLYGLVRAGRAALAAAAPAGAAMPEGISRLWVERLIERVDVEAFGRPEVARILHARLGGHVAGAALDRLWSFTLGNARFLRELVDSALEAGALRRVGETWQWPGLPRTPYPRLAEVVRLHLGRLEPDEAELAGMIALAEPLEAGLAPVEELARAAESLNRRGIVVAERDGRRLRLRFAYPLFGPVLAADLPELTARRLRLRLADAIEAAGGCRAEDGPRMVSLRLAAGHEPPPPQLAAAARSALECCDFVRAERLSRRARAADGGPAPAGTGLVLAQALAGQGRPEEAEEEFARADGCAAQRAANMAWGLRRVEEAAGLVAAAVAARGQQAGLLGAQSELRLLQDRTDDVAAAGSADCPAAPALVPLAAFARIERGDAAGALALLREVRPALGGWDGENRLAAQLLTARAAFQTGETAELATALDRTRRYGAGHRGETRTAVMRARTYRSAGRYAEAVALLRRACALADPFDWFTTPAWTTAQLASSLAEAGEHAEAVRTVVDARAVQRQAVHYPLAADGIALEYALVLAHVGDRSGAVRHAQRVGVGAAAAGRLQQAVTAWHLAGRVGDPGAAAARLADLAVPAEGCGYLALLAAHVHSLARCDGDALDAVADRFAALGVLPLAAEAAAQAARAHHTAGRRRMSRTARMRCAELLAGFDGRLPPWAATPAAEPAAVPARLTTREREVASLAVSRLSNQEIADRLVVSVRTVENHLHRVYGKLGVTARSELAHHL
ncbi:LuxR C-terminal-related transcriptional regulator [Streptomyces sioyaensis]|uniref:helix-turn-helix transcriptional regulator n=1 Tax=Streptomyces sioyaensis TaxID=67364 RepID=UPI0037985AEB